MKWYSVRRGGPDIALDVWVTQEQEGLKGEPVPQILLGLCNPDTQSSVWATLPLTRSERGGANPRAWATLFGQYGVGRVCASEKSAAASFCPLSPAIGSITGEQRHCGGEGGVRGPRRPLGAPHPGPLPTVTSALRFTSPVGRGGRGIGLPTFCYTHSGRGSRTWEWAAIYFLADR